VGCAGFRPSIIGGGNGDHDGGDDRKTKAVFDTHGAVAVGAPIEEFLPAISRRVRPHGIRAREEHPRRVV
jgi:hypothetical protein